MINYLTLLIALLTAGTGFSALSFVSAPSLTRATGENWTVSFELSEAADVEVSIVRVRDSTVVRHLAAGLLGSNPPAPLQADALNQTLNWDGLDDFGHIAASPDSLSVRVRAGMTPRLVNIAGDDVYRFQGGARTSPSLTLEPDGSVLILAKCNQNSYLRKYDASGNYMKTLYPPAAGLPAESVSAYGVNALPGGGWAPKTSYATSWEITMTYSFMNDPNAQMLPIGGADEIVVVRGNDMQILNKNGSFTRATTKPILTGPAAPVDPWRGPWGPQYYTASHNPEYLYLSGKYYGTVNGGCWLIEACTTGFWADGQVFRVNRETGAAAAWLKLDSVPALAAERGVIGGSNAYSAIHGVAIDDSNHVFVCDRMHRGVGVYDTNAVRIGFVTCANPDYAAVSKRTGALYVLTRAEGSVGLRKFADWRNPGAPEASTVLTTSAGDGYMGASVVVLSESNDATNIWLGFGTIGFRLYRDTGAGFELVRDFSTGLPIGFVDRVAVDRATEKMYFVCAAYGAGHKNIWAIADWNNPVPYPCYTTGNTPLGIDDITVGPNGLIYGLPFYDFNTPVTRYTPDSVLAPAPYANTGNNIATCDIHYEGQNHRGMAVGWQGQMAVSWNDGQFTHDDNAIYLYTDTGATDTSYKGRPVVTHTTSKSGGVRFDAAGNLYVGTGIKGPDWQVTPGFGSDEFFTNYSGSIVKYAAGDSGSISGNDAIGAARVYPQPYGLYGGRGASGWCTCRSPRFDVDPYGRLFIPNSATAQIAVADNSGNTLLSFGSYGNTDCRGGLTGPGEVVSSPAFPLAFPTSVAASEDYVYVTDLVNARVMRVKLDYALDNVPGLTEHNNAAASLGATTRVARTLTAAPNPFNPVTRIMVSGARNGSRVTVYDLTGRAVARLQLNQGIASWNADGMASGMYVVEFRDGKHSLKTRITLLK